MSLSRLLPKSAQNVSEDKVNNILYLCMTEWKWSYESFLETPIPILLRLLKIHEKVQKESKRKK